MAEPESIVPEQCTDPTKILLRAVFNANAVPISASVSNRSGHDVAPCKCTGLKWGTWSPWGMKMEGLLLVLVTGWLVWKYYVVVVAKPPKEERGDQNVTYNRYENHLDGFPYRREADGSVVVLTASGEVRYGNWKTFYIAIRPDAQSEEEARQREAQQQQQAEQERAGAQLRQLKREQEREAERLREQRREQENEAERLRQLQREQELAAQKLRQQQQNRAAAPLEKDEDWWTVLEVPPDAGADAIQRAYRKKMMQCHPDRVAGLAPEFGELAERQAKRLNAAYHKAIQAPRSL